MRVVCSAESVVFLKRTHNRHYTMRVLVQRYTRPWSNRSRKQLRFSALLSSPLIVLTPHCGAAIVLTASCICVCVYVCERVENPYPTPLPLSSANDGGAARAHMRSRERNGRASEPATSTTARSRCSFGCVAMRVCAKGDGDSGLA